MRVGSAAIGCSSGTNGRVAIEETTSFGALQKYKSILKYIHSFFHKMKQWKIIQCFSDRIFFLNMQGSICVLTSYELV